MRKLINSTSQKTILQDSENGFQRTSKLKNILKTFSFKRGNKTSTQLVNQRILTLSGVAGSDYTLFLYVYMEFRQTGPRRFSKIIIFDFLFFQVVRYVFQQAGIGISRRHI